MVLLKISISLDGRIKFIFSTFIFVEHAHKTRAAAEDEKKNEGEKRRFNVGAKGRKLSIEIKVLKLRRMSDIEFDFRHAKNKKTQMMIEINYNSGTMRSFEPCNKRS